MNELSLTCLPEMNYGMHTNKTYHELEPLKLTLEHFRRDFFAQLARTGMGEKVQAYVLFCGLKW